MKTIAIEPVAHNLLESIVCGFIFYFLKDSGLSPWLAALAGCPGFALVKLIKHLAEAEDLTRPTLQHIGIDLIWETTYTQVPWILLLVHSFFGRIAWFAALWCVLWLVRLWIRKHYHLQVGSPSTWRSGSLSL